MVEDVLLITISALKIIVRMLKNRRNEGNI